MTDENNIFIGNKPVMNYVLAVVTQINNGTSEVSLKARGRAINRAVDVAEIVKNRFIKEIIVDDIQISTEEVETHEGRVTNVSTIEITLRN